MFNFAISEGPRRASLLPDATERPGWTSQALPLPDGEVLRAFDLGREDRGRLIELKEEVYDRPVDRAVFDWQYLRHPRAQDIRVFVVEHNRRLVAATTRLPAAIRLGGADFPAYFNIDSMVHPEQRRRGRMRDLYLFARTQLPPGAIGLSKGSSPNIYPLLLSIGHREIRPNTVLVSYPSATRWLVSRLNLKRLDRHAVDPATAPSVPVGFNDFRPIERFGADFDAFFERASRGPSAVLARDAAYMNWRYVDIPHRRYRVLGRVEGGELAGVIVLSMVRDQGYIVDLLWDPGREADPSRLVELAKAVFEQERAVRVSCFATHPSVRAALVRAGFVDRGETPRFSAYVPASTETAFARATELHVMDGDGDTEFS